MKKPAMAALIAGQLVTAMPAHAAELAATEHPGSQQIGTFVGARVRVPLAGAGRERTRVALTAAPALHALQTSGQRSVRFGQGLELGNRGNRLQLSYAGRPVSRIVAGATAPDGERRGISTLGWVAIGVGVLAVVVVSAAAICISDSDCIPDE